VGRAGGGSRCRRSGNADGPGYRDSVAGAADEHPDPHENGDDAANGDGDRHEHGDGDQ
jgi:hypothetical protein